MCKESCLKCEISPDYCTSCPKDTYFLDGTCLKQCPDFYSVTNDN